MDLIFSYHPAWIFAALTIATLYTFILYKKNNLLIDVSKNVKLVLSTIRFTAVFTISLLLLGVIIEHFISKTEKPLIFIAHDTSESVIQNKDSSFIKTEYHENLTKLSNTLEEKFEVINYNFSNTISNKTTPNYSGKLTNISKVLDQI